ncbi:ABC transporter permease [bacterium SCSIO 12741]|nr:ABC transporter permease [bacterium SCSIO 12741]
MNYELFIAQRVFRPDSSGTTFSKGTRIILWFAVMGIALGLSAMIIAYSIVTGFQSEIRNKVVGFGSHVQITEFNYENPLNFKPISKNQSFYPSLEDLPQVKKIQVYALKEGIIKTTEEIQGVLAKGVDTDFDWSFFQQHLKEGSLLEINDSAKTNQLMISSTISKKMQIHLHDKVVIFFIQNGKSRPRKMEVVGIFNTGLQQFDKNYVLMDIKHIQKINGWEADKVSGFEVLLNDYEDLLAANKEVYETIPPHLNATPITTQYPEIFGWLELQDMNIVVIVVLMILVCGINMITALLILILEKTNMIGVLKALGAENWSIRKIFLYMAGLLISRGLIVGNVLGIGLLVLQDQFHLVKLPQESYYIDHVSVNMDIPAFILLNIGTLILCLIMLILPSIVISNISPVKSIKFN